MAQKSGTITAKTRTKAIFILNFTNLVDWPNMDKDVEFRIVVLGYDPAMISLLKQRARTKRIRNKPLKILTTTNPNSIPKCHMIYTRKIFGYDIKKIVAAAVVNHSLVVSEGYSYGRSMINFTEHNNRQKFEMNEANIKKAGLKPSESLKSLAWKVSVTEWNNSVEKMNYALKDDNVEITKDDLRSIIKEHNKKLKAIKKQDYLLKKSKILLAKNKKAVKEQEKTLLAKKRELSMKSTEFENLSDNFETQSNNLARQLEKIEAQEKLYQERQELINKQEQVLLAQQGEITVQKNEVSISHKRIDTQKGELDVQKVVLDDQKVVLDTQQKTIYFGVGFLILLLLLTFFIYKSYRDKKKNNEIITKQKEVVEEAHKEIQDSIAYAKRIQSAILPPAKLVKEYLKESFILYKPKHVVAGDFYWMTRKDGKILYAAADCTGHGVPGAMVSVVCNNALNRSVREYGLTDPGQLLDKTRDIVIEEFSKSEEDVKDGMDIAICSIEGLKLKYAGAHNPLWIIRNGEIIETKANKQPIGQFDNPKPYTTHSFDLEKGDSIYVFSDGYVDQFGGERGKKFMAKAFRKLLLSIQDKAMEEQKTIIDDVFEAWRGKLEQIDDVCVIGVKV